MMLTAYLDESGHETKDMVIVAGYFGNESQWRRFAADWRVALGPRKSLHMHELRWKKLRTKRLLETLGPIPENCGLKRLVGIVRVEDYEHLVHGPRLEKLLKGYLVALLAAVIPALMRLPEDERLEVVLENQHEYNHCAGRYLEQLCQLPPILLNKMDIGHHASFKTVDGRSKLASYRFVPKGSTPLLEPADYLAYALLQQWRDVNSLKARWCRSILGTEKHVEWLVTKNQAQAIVLSIPKILGLYSTSRKVERNG